MKGSSSSPLSILNDSNQKPKDDESDATHIFPDRGIVLLIKYLDLGFIYGKLALLSKRFKNTVEAENYLMFKHFLRTFNIPSERLKRSNIPARAPIR
jgi:hypothetical protein